MDSTKKKLKKYTANNTVNENKYARGMWPTSKVVYIDDSWN
jgi:hypothetical protein